MLIYDLLEIRYYADLMRRGRLFKHLLISILAGFAIPVVYVIVSGVLSTYISDARTKHLLWLPIGWPRQVFFELEMLVTHGPPRSGELALIVFQTACNVIPWAAITWAALSYRAFRKDAMAVQAPPAPPEFQK